MQTDTKKIYKILMTIDSSIRNGQFICAYRDVNRLLAEINRNEHSISIKTASLLSDSLKRTSLFLKPIVQIYSQNQTSLNIIRKNE